MGIAWYKYTIAYIREKMNVLPKKNCEKPTNWWISPLVGVNLQVSIVPNGIHPKKKVELSFEKSRFEKCVLSNAWLSGSSSWVYLSR